MITQDKPLHFFACFCGYYIALYHTNSCIVSYIILLVSAIGWELWWKYVRHKDPFGWWDLLADGLGLLAVLFTTSGKWKLQIIGGLMVSIAIYIYSKPWRK